VRFDLAETSEVLVSQFGLALAGALLQGTAIRQRLTSIRVAGHEAPAIPHADNVVAMIGLVGLGKSDFEAIHAFAGESSEVFRCALGLKQVPSEPTRQACASGEPMPSRADKEVWLADTWRQRDGTPERGVAEGIRRTVAADGPALLVPEVGINSFWTSLTAQAGDGAGSADAVPPSWHERAGSCQRLDAALIAASGRGGGHNHAPTKP